MSDKVAALWKGKGKIAYSGEFECPHCQEKTKVVCFENDKGDNPRRPDINVVKSKPMETPPEEVSTVDPF